MRLSLTEISCREQSLGYEVGRERPRYGGGLAASLPMPAGHKHACGLQVMDDTRPSSALEQGERAKRNTFEKSNSAPVPVGL